MKKILIGLLAVFLAFPYMFLLSDVKDVPNSNKEYNCTISKVERVKELIAFGSVYHDLGFFADNKRFVLPRFNFDKDVTFATCGDKEMMIGVLEKDFTYPVGTKIHVYTRLNKVTVAGIEVVTEEGLFMFGTGWSEKESK